MNDNIPAFKPHGTEEVTITINRNQARAILDALNKQFVAEGHEYIRQTYQWLELEVYGPAYSVDGRAEAAKNYHPNRLR